MNDKKFLFDLRCPASGADMIAKAEAMSELELAEELANLAMIVVAADVAGQQLMAMLDARHKLANVPDADMVNC